MFIGSEVASWLWRRGGYFTSTSDVRKALVVAPVNLPRDRLCGRSLKSRVRCFFLGNFREKTERERWCSCVGAADGFETSCKLLSQAWRWLKLSSSVGLNPGLKDFLGWKDLFE